MKVLFQAFWPFGARYETRLLNRDAQYIVDDALGRFSEERVVQMANATRVYLEDARDQLARPNLDPENVLVHFRSLHGAARRERQDMGLSAITLVIIYLRAQRHRDACEPAIRTIDDFVAEWASEDEGNAPAKHTGRLEA